LNNSYYTQFTANAFAKKWEKLILFISEGLPTKESYTMLAPVSIPAFSIPAGD